ncbi:MAG TPA: hypothetical protein VNL95_06440 [Dehalococcoidia bacterium]|nr:hypothetical protein [Dehalococcoidia bacterium]
MALRMPDGRRVSVAEVARRAGVPYRRVWEALTGGRGLSAEERRRIQEALAELAKQGGEGHATA